MSERSVDPIAAAIAVGRRRSARATRRRRASRLVLAALVTALLGAAGCSDQVDVGVGALRLRLVATKGRDEEMTLKGGDGKYLPHVLLDLDIWAFCPL